MANDKKPIEPSGDGTPKFGRLVLILFSVVVFVGFLTFVMETYFPNFG